MDYRMASILHLLVVSSVLCLQSKVEGSSSVFFIDGANHRYIRAQSSNNAVQSPMLLSEVGAAVSVMLGFAPPVALSAAGSSKLNEVLKPNPFDRPRSVFVLQISGVENTNKIIHSSNSMFSSASKHGVDLNSDKFDIEISDINEANVVYLDQLNTLGDRGLTDEGISEFAMWGGGSYVADALKPLNGELAMPVESGAIWKLNMSKKGNRKFIEGLLSLMYNVRRAIEMHEDLSHSMRSPSELLIGSFDGIKALVEQHGPEGVTKQGAELLSATLSKIFDSLQEAYGGQVRGLKGQIVGVILFNENSASESGRVLDVTFASQVASRWLAEEKGLPNATTIAEVILVRRTVAWVTGILLIIATLLGIYYLLNMPLTRDTLLYSNVKLD